MATAHRATIPSTFDCDRASVDRPIGVLTWGKSAHRHPQTERTARLARMPPLGGEHFSWPLGRTETLQGVYVDGNVKDPGDGASGDRTLGSENRGNSSGLV
jgi:hypothetical protein